MSEVQAFENVQNLYDEEVKDFDNNSPANVSIDA